MATAIASFFDFACQPRNLHLHNSISSTLLPTVGCLSFSNRLSLSDFSRGCLSMRISKDRHSVVCMARRYAPNSRLRKRLARKRGGDRQKKNKRRRKRTKKRKGRQGGKKRKESKTIRLQSSAGTGVVYAKRKARQVKEKLKFKKYDPTVRQHVLFEEVK